jgi:outer membrane lipoprotein-sorting protein
MKKLLTLLAFLFIVIQGFQAQTADEVINKYFESVGGIDKWKNLKTVKMTGNMVMQMGEFQFTIYRKAPNKFKIILNIQGQEIVPQAFDGQTAWMINPFTGGTGPTKVPDDQIQAIKDESEFEDPFINYKSKGYDLSYAGTADAAGAQCDVIKLIKNKGVEGKEMSSDYYFDKATGLQMMLKQNGVQSMGQEVEIYLSEYQELPNGILMPFVMDSHMQGKSVQKLNFTAITVDEDIPDDVFKFPEETPAVAPATTN